MTKYYVMYWNDTEDYPVAVFEVVAQDDCEAEDIAYENGGSDFEDWPVLVETDLSPKTVERYKNQSWKTFYKKIN